MSGGALVPDAQWIRKNIPINQVMVKLGLKQAGQRSWFCWRAKHGKANVTIDVKRNRTRCWSCPTRPMSCIDLVMDVLDLEVGQAIMWLAENFRQVPEIKMPTASKAASHELYEKRNSGPPGNLLDGFILHPHWPTLSIGARVLGTAVAARIPQGVNREPILDANYATLQVWSGLGSRSTISNALRELEDEGFLMVGLRAGKMESNRGLWAHTSLRWITLNLGTRHAFEGPEMTTEPAPDGPATGTERGPDGPAIGTERGPDGAPNWSTCGTLNRSPSSSASAAYETGEVKPVARAGDKKSREPEAGGKRGGQVGSEATKPPCELCEGTGWEPSHEAGVRRVRGCICKRKTKVKKSSEVPMPHIEKPEGIAKGEGKPTTELQPTPKPEAEPTTRRLSREEVLGDLHPDVAVQIGAVASKLGIPTESEILEEETRRRQLPQPQKVGLLQAEEDRKLKAPSESESRLLVVQSASPTEGPDVDHAALVLQQAASIKSGDLKFTHRDSKRLGEPTTTAEGQLAPSMGVKVIEEPKRDPEPRGRRMRHLGVNERSSV